jgi:hypothetical protein
MANEIITQTCSHCGETKPLDREHFHKNKGRKCGFMALCKPCQMKKVEKYNREHKEYWKQYRIDKEDYIRDYWEDYYEQDTCKIYGIMNPIGETYVGFTQKKKIDIRIAQHQSDYRIKHGSYGKLHESVDKYGWDEHTTFLIEEVKTKKRDRGLATETKWIEFYMKIGKSLNMKSK